MFISIRPIHLKSRLSLSVQEIGFFYVRNRLTYEVHILLVLILIGVTLSKKENRTLLRPKF